MADPKILVLRGGAIGDFVLTLPAFAMLRERWPNSRIEIVGYPHIAQLACVGGLADDVRSLDAARIAALFSLKPAIPLELASYLASFDIVLSYLYDPDGTVQDNMTAAGARRLIYGNPRVSGIHAADFLIRPLESLAIYPEGPASPRLAVRSDCRDAGVSILSGFGRRVAILHPGSGGVQKRWPLAGFLALAQLLSRECRLVPVLMLGEADDDIAVALQTEGVVWPVLRGLSLSEVAGVLCGASLYVGNDSGITHLAAAVGTKTVALFGASDPAIWGPRGLHVRVCRVDPPGVLAAGTLSVQKVWSCVEEFIKMQADGDFLLDGEGVMSQSSRQSIGAVEIGTVERGQFHVEPISDLVFQRHRH